MATCKGCGEQIHLETDDLITCGGVCRTARQLDKRREALNDTTANQTSN